MDKTLNVELLVSYDIVMMEDIADFKIGLKITNRSAETVFPAITNSELFVNSEKSFAWDLTVQNGTIVNMKISPKKSKTIEWPLGEALFETIGTYDLELRWGPFVQKQKVIVS